MLNNDKEFESYNKIINELRDTLNRDKDSHGPLGKLVTKDKEAEKRYGIDHIRTYCFFRGGWYPSLVIQGEVFGKLKADKIMIGCTIYDKEGDVIGSFQNDGYGRSGFVSNEIPRKGFFDGYPFSMNHRVDFPIEEIGEILIYPME